MHSVSAVQSSLLSVESFLPWGIGVLLVISTAPLLARTHKYFELTSHFRAQYFLASFICVLMCLLYRNWWYVPIALMAMAINLLAIAPFYKGESPAISSNRKNRCLKLALININHSNFAYSRFLAWAQQNPVDVLVVQEVNQSWIDALRELTQVYPFSQTLPRDQGSGMALYSRLPLEQLPVELSEGNARPSLCARLTLGNARVFVFSFHPRAPIRPGHFELRNQMLASSANYIQGLPGSTICAGDFNTSPWSPFYQDFVRKTQLVDVRKGFGRLPTWPTFLVSRWLMIPIDHCLVSRDINVTKVTTGKSVGSDHLPLIVDLEIPQTE